MSPSKEDIAVELCWQNAWGAMDSPLLEGAAQQSLWEFAGSWNSPAWLYSLPIPQHSTEETWQPPALLPELTFHGLFLPIPCGFCNVASKIKKVGWALPQPPSLL